MDFKPITTIEEMSLLDFLNYGCNHNDVVTDEPLCPVAGSECPGKKVSEEKGIEHE